MSKPSRAAPCGIERITRAGLLVLAGAGFIQSASTQDAPDPETPVPALSIPERFRNTTEEIIVTANRREESVQDAVGGIQAFSGSDLKAAGAAGFKDYLAQVPGAGFRQDGSGNTKIGLRGVSNISGNQLGTLSGASPVGIYLNDVPIQDRPDANDSNAQSVRLLTSYRANDRLTADVLYLHDRNHQQGSPNVRPETEAQLSNDIYKPEMSLSNFDLGGLTLKYDFDGFQLTLVTSVVAGGASRRVPAAAAEIDHPGQSRRRSDRAGRLGAATGTARRPGVRCRADRPGTLR